MLRVNSRMSLQLWITLFLCLGTLKSWASPQPQLNGSTTFTMVNTRVGSAGVNSDYRLTPEASVVEQARLHVQMGAEAFKFQGLGPRYREAYPDLPELPANKKDTITELLQNLPEYQTVFNLPIKFYAFYVYPMWMDSYSVIDAGYSSTIWAQREYNEIYELTRYLMQTYQNTGKVFMFGNWETDWPLLEGQGDGGDPRPGRIQGFIEWFNNRYKAVNDARNSLPNIKGVEVIYYEEVNIIQKLIDNPTSKGVTNAVLPNVTVDAVSYSAYNAINHIEQLPQRLHTHLDYIQSKAHLSGKWNYGKPVFIGEYNYTTLYNSPERASRGRLALRSAGSWGTPLIFYWMTYSGYYVTPWDTAAWVDPDGNFTNEYFDQQEYVQKIHVLKNASRVWLDRNPTEAEINTLSASFDTLSNADIIRGVINSAAAALVISNRDFLDLLFRQTLRSLDFSQPLFQNLLSGLNAGTISRWDAILQILDSSQAATVVNNVDYLNYLVEYQRLFPKPSVYSGTRSSNWVDALNTKTFRAHELYMRNRNTVDESIYRKYMPWLDSSIAFGNQALSTEPIQNLTPATRAAGYKYFDGAFTEAGSGTISELAGASGGDLLILQDKSLYKVNRSGFNHASNNEMRFIFRGSGVEFNYLRWDQTDKLHYDLNNGQYSGSFNTWGTPGILTRVVAPSGSLNPDQIHLLRIWVTDDSGEGGWNKVIGLDSIHVFDPQPIHSIDSLDYAWRYSGDWVLNTSGKAVNAGQGTFVQAFTGSSASVDFTGNSFAIIGARESSRTGTYQWRIGNGSQYSGTVDQSIDGNPEFAFRWPDVVVNGLPSGQHTLTITVMGAGAYPGTLAYIDGIVYASNVPNKSAKADRGWEIYQ